MTFIANEIIRLLSDGHLVALPISERPDDGSSWLNAKGLPQRELISVRAARALTQKSMRSNESLSPR